LNSIINYLEVALEVPLDERARSHLYRSLQASKALVFVVNDLLSLTEVEGIDFKTHEDNVNLKSMISEIIAAFKNESARRELEIVLQEDEAVPNVVRCDPAGLRQVLSNLLTNAIEHGTGDLVNINLSHLSTTDENTLVEISFQDRGKGLTEAELDSIFLDLEQVLDEDDVISKDLQGVKEAEPSRPKFIGLGLAFTARFVRLNYGQITMSSKQGKGTRVSVKIPFRKAVPAKTPPESPMGLPLPTPPCDIPYPISAALGSSNKAKILENVPIQTTNSALQTTNSVASTTSPLIGASTTPALTRYPFPDMRGGQPKFNILIAEDNPLNSRLLETRLTKRGHSVKVTVDGQACADAFMRSPNAFDVILMDLQVPFPIHYFLSPIPISYPTCT
jgi:CheY-like chemotaxis protein